ncbi:hypothetical protein CP972_05330 [Streptomyces prasinus]|uniref:Uncharacterized protein n=1 Tax=Streptomyces prasinus TaxID=67345 RepID=A0ABX6ARU2_9ACTN|nr:hypothetical protein CP972_05330 [Streptomyces prasinus]
MHRKAEEGARAEPWGPTTTRRGAVPDPASPARSKREALGVRAGAGGPPAGAQTGRSSVLQNSDS